MGKGVRPAGGIRTDEVSPQGARPADLVETGGTRSSGYTTVPEGVPATPRRGHTTRPVPSIYQRALRLLEAEPRLGGLITFGFRLDGLDGTRLPPHGTLTGHRTPWGHQSGLLDREDRFLADLDLLPPQSQAVLAQRLDQGGCTLVASCTEPPWAHLADRAAFWLGPGARQPHQVPQAGRPVGLARALELIAAAALELAVEGHRAEAFALLAAEAAARCAGRSRLYEGDLAEAIGLVLAPRSRAVPEAEQAPEQRPSNPIHQEAEAEAPPLPVPMEPLPTAPLKTRPSLHGAPVRSVPGRRRRGTLDLTATLLAALPWQKLRGADGLPPAIRGADLRWHLRRPRQGRLIIFAVDASGSMGARRLGQAKGAVLKLLQEAYRKRDQVALLSAAGPEARLLLPPARAVEQARRRLVALPAGGATPLASALLQAHGLAVRARRRDGRPSLLVLMTDGRANQPLHGTDRAAVREELRRVSLLCRGVGMESVLVGQPGSEAAELARWLGAQFRLIGRSPITEAIK